MSFLRQRTKNKKTFFSRPLSLILSNLALFSFGCSHNIAHKPIATQSEPQCSFDNKNISLTLANGQSFAIEIPGEFKLSAPIFISCETNRTIIVTREGIIRTLGIDDFLKGKEMLGVFTDGRFFPQNAFMFFTLGSLGPLSSASFIGDMLHIQTTEGRSCLINIEQPSKSASCQR